MGMQEEDINNPPSEKALNSSYCSECSIMPLCPAISGIGNTILFVEYDVNLHCDKAMAFGFSHVCRCKERLKYYLTHRK